MDNHAKMRATGRRVHAAFYPVQPTLRTEPAATAD